METDPRDQTFAELRPLLLSIAYRMLGSATEADDVVQESYLRWQRSHEEIISAKAYLATVVTRLCIDAQRAARLRRSEYMGTWLPEPIPDEAVVPDDPVELSESLSMAFLVVLETLSPVERAVFVLREIFEFEYEEIATIVDKSDENCRQIGRRAKEAVSAKRPRFAPSREYRERIVEEFETAARSGNSERLVQLFSEDIAVWADGGPDASARFGRLRALREPVIGRERAIRFFATVKSSWPEGTSTGRAIINGEPSVVARFDGQVIGVVSLDISEGVIRGIYIIADPNKLKRLALAH